MDILFITATLEPGTNHPEAHAVAGLSKALRGLGHKVSILSPMYRGVDPTARSLARRLTKIEVELGEGPIGLELYTGRLPNGVDVVYLGHERLFGSAEALESSDALESARRLSAFASGAAAYLRSVDKPYDAVHAYGVAGAAAAAAIRHTETAEGRPLLVGVVDPRDQGRYEGEAAALLKGALGVSAEHGTGANLLEAGLLVADAVTAVSPTAARALRTDEGGHGLGSVYRELGARLSGVLLGVDSAVWNPLTDPYLASRFDPIDRAGKERSKAALQRKLALPVRDDLPLIVAVGRTETGQGMDLLAKVADQVLRNDVQLVVQVEGGGELVAELEELWDAYPDRIQIRTGNDPSVTHQLVGASDLYVLPRLDGFPAELVLAAQRYGSLPIAPTEAVVADAIVDCDAQLTTGSGFLYEGLSEDALLGAIRRGIASFTRRHAFEGVRSRMMRVDRSLERSARLYERLYRDIAGELRAREASA